MIIVKLEGALRLLHFRSEALGSWGGRLDNRDMYISRNHHR